VFSVTLTCLVFSPPHLQIINVPLIVLGARPGGLDLKVLDVR